MKTKIRTCSCNKYCYSSESSAQRAVNSYPDLKRTYKCPHDNTFWHTTSSNKHNKLEVQNIALKKRLSYLQGKIKNLEHNIEQQKESIEYWRNKSKSSLLTNLINKIKKL